MIDKIATSDRWDDLARPGEPEWLGRYRQHQRERTAAGLAAKNVSQWLKDQEDEGPAEAEHG